MFYVIMSYVCNKVQKKVGYKYIIFPPRPNTFDLPMTHTYHLNLESMRRSSS